MVPNPIRAVTQITVAITSYYPQYFTVIAHCGSLCCGFDFAFPEEWHIAPLWGPLP